ncbi:hypothetical protein UPYG_G00265530 [Umbra pygmaea]|uniref:Zinc finger homeobox protein 3-like n=1 Tax=Umbra pygmaea TaxID=75934 RepID=A0ABD0WXB9_UMBPY
MALLHSRNSCKTLKCPKCNWHYKSQQTLQTHLREKHPESGGLCVCGGLGEKCVCGESRDVCVYCSSGKAHPRLSRGETYVCGYKPYRCGVCDYATSSKGNLSIHMQSDKHLSNVQAAGQAVHSIHLSPTVSQPPALIAPNPSQTQSQGKRWRCELQRSYYLAHCRSLPAQLPSLHSPGMEKSTDMHQLTAVEPVAPESTLTPSPSPPPSSSSPSPSPSPSPSLSPPPSSSLSPGVFQCLVCSSFSSDSLESLGSHLGTPRSLPQSEWRCLVGGGCYCRLCGYSTPLRANFSLHCQTDRHRARYQLAAHLWEGGEKGEAVDWEKIGKLVATGNPVQLRCNMCEFQTSSLDNLKAHSMNAQHLSSLKVYRFLQQYDSAVDTESWSFHCILCNYSSRSKLHLLRHNHSLGHQKKAELHKLPVLDGRSLEEEEELAATFTIQKILIPETDGSSEEEWERKDSPSPAKRTFSGLMEIQSSLSPKRPRTDPQATPLEATAKCPLCQNTLEHKRLRHHLTHTHSVAQDCVDKLMSVVNVAVKLPESLEKNDSNTNGSHSNGSSTKESLTNGSETNDSHTNNNEVIPAKDADSLLTPPCEAQHPAEDRPSPLPVSISSPPSSPTPPTLSTSQHPSPASSPSPPTDAPPLSDRHGYKFRCGKCSLAFQTQEKLQLHWQYHAMRAATECHLCSRRCRSQEALQRHLLNTHLPDPQDTHGGQSGECVRHPASPTAEEEDGEHMSEEEQDRKEKEEYGEDEDQRDEEDEERPGPGIGDSVQDVGQQVDEVGSEPSPFSKGTNPTLERFLDPARPYKCSVCCESFTQRTILLVHQNSVSHLHRARARQALQDTTSSPPANPQGIDPKMYICSPALDPRPYRCRLCGVAYSQSSTLDIHLRSVLHQTRARAARTQLALKPPTQRTLAPTSTHPPYTQDPALVLTQTPAFSPSPEEGECSTTRPAPASPSLCASLGEAQLSVGVSGQTEGRHAKRRRVDNLTASGGQQDLTLLKQQLAHAQLLQQHTALLQPQLFSPTLLPQHPLLKQHLPKAAENQKQGSVLPPLPFSPDSLFSLQQQMLLSFYLSGGLQLNPNINQPGSASSPQTPSASSLQTTSASSPQTPSASSLQTTSASSPQTPPASSLQTTSASSPQTPSASSLQTTSASSPQTPSASSIQTTPSSSLQTTPSSSLQTTSSLSLQTTPSSSVQTTSSSTLQTTSSSSLQTTSSSSLQTTSSSSLQTTSSSFLPTTPSSSLQTTPSSSIQETLSSTLQTIPSSSLQTTSSSSLQTTSGLSSQTAGLDLPSLKPETTGIYAPSQLAGSQTQAETVDSQEPNPSSSPEGGGQWSKELHEREKRERAEKALRVLLERYGWELALQSTQSRQRWHHAEGDGSLERKEKPCGECGKLFSDSLILKSHQEFVHCQMIPPVELERFSRKYRLQYDRLYTLTPPTEGVTAASPSAADLKPASSHELLPLPPAPASKSTLNQTPAPALSIPTSPASVPFPLGPSPAPILAPDPAPAVLSPPGSLPGILSEAQGPVPTLSLDSPTPSTPPPEQQDASRTTTSPEPYPTIIPQPKHSIPPPSLPQLSLTSLPLANLPLPPLPLTIDPPLLPLGLMQPIALQSILHPALPSLKRRLEEGPMSDIMVSDRQDGGDREADRDEQRRDRRQRTTISAEQLEVLYQRYSLNSNPTRSVLEGITRDTGLKKRVVQVWFQNTRARHRKGQLQNLGRGGGDVGLAENHRRCPFCRALFKAQSALDAHVRARHWSQADRAATVLSPHTGPADDSGFSHTHGSSPSSLTTMVPPFSIQPSLSSSSCPGTIPAKKEDISEKKDLIFDLNEPDIKEEEEEEEGDLSVNISPLCDQAQECKRSNLLSLGYNYGMASFNVQDYDQSTSPSLSESVDRQGPRTQQQQRQRTQMTPQQISQLKACYREHSNPTPQQCECLGRQLGLPRRVVQVWFQNARAKEKRARSLRVNPTTG